MKNNYIIDIRINPNGTSYTAMCNPLSINYTIHHHDLDSFIKKWNDKGIMVNLKNILKIHLSNKKQ